MNNFSSSSLSDVPAIRIHGTDDASTLFDGGDMFPTDMNVYLEEAGLYACSQGLYDYLPSNSSLNNSSELEDIPELAHLSTMQPLLTGYGYSQPFPAIMQDSTCIDQGLSPSRLGSPIPSPTPSFSSSLSPSSMYDLAFSDSESLSPDTPDGPTSWSPSQGLNHKSIGPLFISSDPFPPCSQPITGPQRHRTHPSPSRNGPVASKAMIEANGRRRRHPAQFECKDCNQTFTALFSLKRHIQSHTGERPFQCSIQGCTQRFYNSSDCKRHEKSKKRHKELLV